MKRIILAVIATISAVLAFAAPAHAADVEAQNFPDVFGINGTNLLTTNFATFMQQHPGYNINVCVTAKGSGGAEAMRVKDSGGGFNRLIGNFGTGGFSEQCVNINPFSGSGDVILTPVSAGGGGAYLRKLKMCVVGTC